MTYSQHAWGVIVGEDNRFHVVPVNARTEEVLKGHVLSVRCPCHPDRDDRDIEIIVHQSIQ